MGSGQEATIKFSFKLPPETKSTRAEIPGNTVENQISGIMIYVYDQAGNPPTEPTKASFGPYDLNNTAEFIKNGSVYEMVNPVKTTDGTKRIYVVANTNTASPANDLGTFGTESQLLSRIYDVHKAGTQGALINYNATPVVTHIVFAGSTQQQLLPSTSGQTNQVQVDIERTVSRVITTCDDGSFTGEWTSGNNYTLTISKFLVKQDAYKGVVGQNYFDAPNVTRKKH
ncbi:MAG: fimbrial protein [Rikenellaceae bacterium]|nr:fimbrial protein [Rikenellaceae bacterium]